MTDKYAVIGNPIAHSKSPQIHRMFAEQTGQDISYEAVLAPLDGFVQTIERLRREGYKGCNVTVPFKFETFQLATYRSERAEAAQAANTLTFEGDGIVADNTDGVGLVADLRKNSQYQLHGRRVLLLGAGGAAMGVLLPLLQALPRRLVLANRTLARAEQAIERVRRGAQQAGEFVAKGFSDLAGEQFDLIINATSSGLSDEMPDIPATIFARGALAYDMMYGRETPFMAFARTQGARVADGLGMLVEQAAEAFFIWRGVRPDTAPVIARLREK